MHAQLIPFDGTATIDIVKDLTLVGRREECDLRLAHKSISKLHCVIVKTDGLLFLRDLGSTNGTRVNGERVRRAALLPNDLLAVAGHKFRVSLGPDQPAEAHTGRTQQLEPGNSRSYRARPTCVIRSRISAIPPRRRCSPILCLTATRRAKRIHAKRPSGQANPRCAPPVASRASLLRLHYYPGTTVSPVGQAFEPDWDAPSGSKA